MMTGRDQLSLRLHKMGGLTQEERMITDKRKSFEKALLYSYQAAEIRKIGETEYYKALMNPDKLNNSYDVKNLSVDFSHNYSCGDIFEWKGTNSYWIVCLQQLTEDAYFRADVRRCRHQISWYNDQDELQTSWVSIKGPNQSTISSDTFDKIISVDVPNLIIQMYIPNTAETRAKFNRYFKFMFNGKTWKVTAVDDISLEGILIVSAKENFTNEVTSDLENEVSDAKEYVPTLEHITDDIIGEIQISPLLEYTYNFTTLDDPGQWIIDPKAPIKLNSNKGSATLVWNNMKSGNFLLKYISSSGIEYKKEIIVKSLV